MIPNIIHYCWFSGEEMPEIVKACIASWHEHMPDYEYRLWDMESIRDVDVPFLREALECRKWAFAADYVRLYAVEKYGGIYIDADVEVFKSLDPYLSNRMFIGREISANMLGNRPLNFLTSHIFGAEAHHPFLKSCLKYYETRRFIIAHDEELPEQLRYELRISPEVQAMVASLNYGYDASLRNNHVQYCSQGLVIYPSEIFDAAFPSKDSVCRHLCLGSWRTKPEGKMALCKEPLLGRLVGSPKLKYRFFRLLNRLGYMFVRI